MANDKFKDLDEKYKISNKKKNVSNEDVQLSKVPPPLRTLKGAGPTFFARKTIAEKPNWKEWKHMPEVQVWQACALSLDIEPNSIKRNPHSWETGPGFDQFFEDESFQNEKVKKEFESRQRMLLKNLSSKENSLCFRIHSEHPNLSKVHLPEFAAWCPSVEWVIPKELAALAKKLDTVTVENTQVNLSVPKGVPKQEIIEAFEGLHFDKEKWSTNLADPPKWLKDCRVVMGNARESALWNPVDIAIALNSKNIQLWKLDKIFTIPSWEKWNDEWLEKSAFLRL